MRKRILVIGGGAAGLSAARELLRAGRTVTVLEAKDRLGGRIHTLRDDRLPVELGAEFLHGQSKAVSELMQRAGLHAREASDQHRLSECGELHRAGVWEEMSRLLHQVNPRAPDCSFKQFLSSQTIPERARALALGFVQGFHAADPDRVGVHSLLRGEVSAEKMNSSWQGRIVEGYGNLVDFLEREIIANHGTIITGAKVGAVNWKRGAVEVRYEQPGSRERLEADAAVITVSLGVLKSGAIEFNPPLASRNDAVSGLLFGNVVKIVLVFCERWWAEEDFGFIQALDEEIPTWWSDPRGPMIVGWAGGPKADALLDRSPERLRQLSLDTLRKLFGSRMPGENLAAWHFHDWAHDPHVLGAYSYIPPNGLDLPKLLGASVAETLFFAGEATVSDAQTGIVSGAIETGQRAAREVLGGGAIGPKP